MSTIETTKMSSRGQVVIPEEIRNKLNLKTGDQFLVLGDKDIIILKTLASPSINEFDNLIQEAHKQAKVVHLKASDITSAIAENAQKEVIVVLDTNVLMSGIFFSGPPYQILQAWRNGHVQFALTPEIVEEYFATTRKLADKFPEIKINTLLDLIVTRSVLVRAPVLKPPVCEDLDDDKFLACAFVCKSSIIISGDKHLLKLSGYQGLDIITPRKFVDKYLHIPPDAP